MAKKSANNPENVPANNDTENLTEKDTNNVSDMPANNPENVPANVPENENTTIKHTLSAMPVVVLSTDREYAIAQATEKLAAYVPERAEADRAELLKPKARGRKMSAAKREEKLEAIAKWEDSAKQHVVATTAPLAINNAYVAVGFTRGNELDVPLLTTQLATLGYEQMSQYLKDSDTLGTLLSEWERISGSESSRDYSAEFASAIKWTSTPNVPADNLYRVMVRVDKEGNATIALAAISRANLDA